MFIVYSPEGRNRIGQPDPARQPLRVDRTKPSSEVEESPDFPMPQASTSHASGGAQAAAHYASVQEEHARRVVVKIGEIMSSPVVTATPDMPLVEAWQRMQDRKINHLPVINEVTRGVIGLVSSHLILMHAIVDENNQLLLENSVSTVADVMETSVLTTRAETDIRRAAQAMSVYEIGCLPIMDDQEHLTGMVTLSDIVKRLGEEPPLEIYA
ncbi:HPP family protein [Thiomicrospira sp. WB1]|uniref:CBS domain-containing protein n=1 Tax=Thiomicrospira sp. WB1 TaxID=1685380 RepID=UPI00074A4969|nr:CBS domain-containing protein [Thiomicrospira sp. WB1]KUJ71930.1 hypothetical protein AVO41_05625 [Thiomicrospira sp. WB1]